MKGSVCALAAAASFLAVPSAAFAGEGPGQLLYDIDFSAPFHVGGNNVSVDTGPTPREGVTGYFLTDPADEPVVDDVFALRAMSGGVARFNSGAQAVLEIESGAVNGAAIPGADFDRYILEFNAAVAELGTLTVFFDAPAINRVRFSRQAPGFSSAGIFYGSQTSDPELATYTFGELLAVRMVLDIADQSWSVEVDGETLYDGPLQNAATELSRVRFSADAPVILDNITLRGVNPALCGVADLNDDGLLDLSDVTTFVESFLNGCGN